MVQITNRFNLNTKDNFLIVYDLTKIPSKNKPRVPIEDNDDFQIRQKSIKNLEHSSIFFNKLNNYFEALIYNNIIPQHNWTCCRPCGVAKIQEFYNEYIGYIFYHTSEYTSITDQLEDTSCDIIKINLNWGIFGNNNILQAQDYIDFSNIISQIADTMKITIDSNIDGVVVMHINLNE
jgi:hypothetical protein